MFHQPPQSNGGNAHPTPPGKNHPFHVRNSAIIVESLEEINEAELYAEERGYITHEDVNWAQAIMERRYT